MKVVGIIAEYNPFHNGHYYQIEYARTVLKADAVIVVMSGNFVQRGEPALFDKYTRAHMALLNGADMVLEMPVIASTSSAELFAKCGINLLLSTGVVSDVIFGCEDESEQMFRGVARLLLEEPVRFKSTLDAELRSGESFAKARAKAILSAWENEDERIVLSHFLSSPNNILGIEYTKAILASQKKIQIHPLGRIGVSHDDLKFDGSYASATFLRQTLTNEGASEMDIFSFVPKNCLDDIKIALKDKQWIAPDDISLLLHHKLLSKKDFSHYLDCSKDMSHKIINAIDSFIDFTRFCDLLKTKNLNHSRIRRVLTHIYLGIKDTDKTALENCNFAPYLHILGFTKRGAGLLNTIKNNPDQVPLFTSPMEAKEVLNQDQKIILKRDLDAADDYRILLTYKTRKSYPTEFTRKFIPHEDAEFVALMSDINDGTI